MTELQNERRKGKWHRLWIPFFEGWSVLKDPSARSQHIVAYWTRDQIRLDINGTLEVFIKVSYIIEP